MADRVRTQAERHTDDHTWRQTAQSRPGFATYQQTPPGDPSWWRHRHDAYLRLSPVARVMAYPDGPPPVDGETCKQWCGYCHPVDERELARVRDAMDRAFAEPLDGPPRREPPPEPTGFLLVQPPPRRRWWHRYTRRNP